MKTYISGPINGTFALNEGMFRAAAKAVRNGRGGDVVVPHDIKPWSHDGKPCRQTRYTEGADHCDGCYLRTDISELVQCDAICLLPGWMRSDGAKLELTIALACGLTVLYYTPLDGVRTME